MKLDASERAAYWTSRVASAEQAVADWAVRGETWITRGATNRAIEWRDNVRRLADDWAYRARQQSSLRQAA